MPNDQPQPDRIAFEVAEGPNTEGHADMARTAHALPAEPTAVITESAIDSATRETTRDIEPSMPAPQEG